LIIETSGLRKQFGPTLAVSDLSLGVREGEVFGFLGPNGAGKTTTIRLLLGLIFPTAGRMRVLGLDPNTDGVAVHRRVGYLPGELALYEHLTGRQLLEFMAGLRGMTDLGYAMSVADRLGLDLGRRIHDLSKGNKQKVGLLQAFAHRPDLLILDEPTSGLDPLVQQEFGRLVRETVAEGRTVFLSSHVLAEVQDLADRAGIVREGRLVAVEDIDALSARAGTRVEVRFAGAAPQLGDLDGVRDTKVDGDLLTCIVDGDVDPLVKAVAAYHVVSFTSASADLEDVFLGYYVRGDQDAA
jgi:beta-exotoxin I transport system ATP-binding protein